MKINIIAVSGVLLFCAQALPSFAAEPAANYGKMCVSCHGKDRKGAPAMVKMFKLEPAAMDLTDKAFLAMSDADIAAIISGGKGKMPAHKARLTAAEITAIVSYLKAADAKTAETKAADVKAPEAKAAEVKPAAPAAAPAKPAAKAAENADYKAKCASCHGKDGKGSPSMAKMFKLEPAALDLTAKATQEKTDDAVAKLISDGKGKMPAFKSKLGEAQIKELVKFIKTLK
ncbi:MAG: c-type cytochrome [Elusimicrobiales bacterium]|nr:c-type cytochrome [Elusimicrobiales bacterium]